MNISPLAGQPAPVDILVDVPRLVSDYFTTVPDTAAAAQRVAFGTSGHRGTSFDLSFNEAHVLAITQAICEYRKQQGIDVKALADKLQVDGAESFVKSWAELMKRIADKSRALAKS